MQVLRLCGYAVLQAEDPPVGGDEVPLSGIVQVMQVVIGLVFLDPLPGGVGVGKKMASGVRQQTKNIHSFSSV